MYQLSWKYLLTFSLLACAATARAGHQAPSFIDGGQSQDGRYQVTAEPLGNVTLHGPNRWEFVWRDTRTGEQRRFAAREVQTGQIYAQLLVAPDGGTFALWNHVQEWTDTLSGKAPPKPEHNLHDPAFSRRLIVYRNDGTVVKMLGVADFLTEPEFAETLVVFHRVHWCLDYPGLSYRKTPRPGYAFFQVSPDYSVLEVRIATPKKLKTAPRTVRVELTSGRILPEAEWLTSVDKTPVRSFTGPAVLEAVSKHGRELYVPSLDPVRTAGRLPTEEIVPPSVPVSAAAVAAEPVPAVPPRLELVASGYKKADTPTWLPAEKCWLFVDLEPKQLFRLDPPQAVKPVLQEAGRGKVGPDGNWYGMINTQFVSWKPGAEQPQLILGEAAPGRAWQVNDLAVSAAGRAYLTTLKDPDKGRLTVVDLAKRTATVAWDGEQDADLVNPNGVALSPDGKSLYVGISSYANRKKSCVYRLPLGDDGLPDQAAGKKQRFADVAAPDGIAVAADGAVYFTAGSVVKVFSADGQRLADIKIPKGSGTNLALGGADGRTLFVTTNEALYSCSVSLNPVPNPK